MFRDNTATDDDDGSGDHRRTPSTVFPELVNKDTAGRNGGGGQPLIPLR